VLTYPAVPRDQSRLRMFVTSEHTDAQLDRAADILRRAAKQFEFEKLS
jgi:7-keto-8-aminopelargonate synthetase-like enzyme